MSLVVVEDSATGPEVTFRRTQPCPNESDPGRRSAWFGRVVAEAMDAVDVAGVAVRVADAGPVQDRAEAEGAVLSTAGQRGVPAVTLRRQSLVKPLSVPRASGAWASFQKNDPFVGSLPAKEKDAAMASLAAARR